MLALPTKCIQLRVNVRRYKNMCTAFCFPHICEFLCTYRNGKCGGLPFGDKMKYVHTYGSINCIDRYCHSAHKFHQYEK